MFSRARFCLHSFFFFFRFRFCGSKLQSGCTRRRALIDCARECSDLVSRLFQRSTDRRLDTNRPRFSVGCICSLEYLARLAKALAKKCKYGKMHARDMEETRLAGWLSLTVRVSDNRGDFRLPLGRGKVSATLKALHRRRVGGFPVIFPWVSNALCRGVAVRRRMTAWRHHRSQQEVGKDFWLPQA